MEAVGLIGLAVMGQNLALNLAEKGHRVVVFNRTTSVTDRFVADHDKGFDLVGASDLADLCRQLPNPRAVILMVKAGDAVDKVVADLVPNLHEGDVVIDGGNSHWRDTERRVEAMQTKGIHFIGAGVSGGEEGARHGPSIMPGGAEAGWEVVGESLQSIAAKVDDEPCCAWLGPGGSGHFVKMVHNGIEYADMQLIAEIYDLLRASGRSVHESGAVFRRWQSGPLDSFLIDITATILEAKDEAGQPLVDSVLDAAAQKGTGRWTIEAALELGQPTTVIAEAVMARSLSAMKEERIAASQVLGTADTPDVDEDDLESALLAAKVVSYAQGFMTIRAASTERGWGLAPATIAPLWRGGCIIRAALLKEITRCFLAVPDMTNLLLDDHFAQLMRDREEGLRRSIQAAVGAGIPVPALSAALAFYDGYRRSRLPANLIQAQRDLFGAHTYERVDRPRGKSFHSNWAAGTTESADS